MVCEVTMEMHIRNQPTSEQPMKDVPKPTQQIGNGYSWWRPSSSILGTSSNTTTTSISSSNSCPPQQQQRGEDESPSSLFNGAAAQQFETQQKPKTLSSHQLWTRGSRDGTEAPSPEDDDDRSYSNNAASATAPSLSPAYSNESARRRRPEQDLLGSSSGKLKSLKLAQTGSAPCSSAIGSDCPVSVVCGGSDGGDMIWSLGSPRGHRHDQQDQREQQRRRLDEQRRTPSKPPRPQQQQRYGDENESDAMATAQPGAEGGGSSSSNSDCWKDEGIDDEMAAKVNTRRVVYDILAVDRGCGYCDTSVVPFPVEEGGQVAAGQLRAFTSGKDEFLARRGFAAGLVSHFLEETNCEFRVLQGGESCGMNTLQLEEAAIRLEEAFVPAIKRLRERASTDVVLDSLFRGADDAGEFVVRFEVSLTRCHPEDIDSSPATALRECAPAIREAVREEGIKDQETHEVVFVGRPMWELVSPVLNFAAQAGVAVTSD